ncbi:MAG TPA: 5'/3'-nucleotidase SurE [Clostridia bacterium]|jgi:5'-nucleotidase|nr:5'/3'-nucleotidase SurE [Clostridia bacterium]HPA60544.1 5'/3'-nucleotidase SurE [Clostridia bacterium]HPY43476.1 5'/3'-nucleotidase SurE [Clostridia bacterium]HQA96441.1 5'/3'-nucleotidase SurE [Clostridia bacterium]HQO55443.1 5'/3'-nucleotidase SurE [Clostridia bacterium]
MHLLITNDDGIQAQGILTLARVAVKAGHTVMIVAPATQQSATGHRLTINESLMVQTRSIDPDFESFAINGTPVDCVRIGRKLSDRPFDFCLSGINDGLNVGTDLFYSGTAAAAREAAMLYLPSMAISIESHADEDMLVHLAEQALMIMDYIIKRPMPRLTFCNLNAPCLPPGKVKPAKITPISESYWLDEYVERVNPRGQRYFWLENGVLKEEAEAGTDAVMIQQGHLTVSFVGGFVNNNALYYPKLEEILG